MSSDSDSRHKKNGGLGWAALFIVALGAFALGGWIFRSKTPPAPLDSTTSTPGARSPHDASFASASKADDVPTTVKRPGDDPQLEALRAKLAVSVEDTLRSLAEIGKTNPALAIELAQKLGRTEEEKSTWVKISMQQWADRDPQSAFDWLQHLSFKHIDELAGGELTSLVLGTMAARDPKMVLANVDTLLRNGNPSEAVSTPVAMHLGLMALVEQGKIELARDAVEKWARDPANLTVEAAAFDAVAMELAKTAPQETGQWLRSLPVNEERNAAISTFTATWAEHDPRAALQWAESLPPNEGQQAAIARTVSDSIERNPTEVGGWLAEYLPRIAPSPEADTLVNTVINLSPAVQSDPSLALKWTNLISDPQKRIAAEEKIAAQWGEHDSAAAVDYVRRSTTLPPDRKASLIQKILTPESSEN
jgi:hypothetical protein